MKIEILKKIEFTEFIPENIEERILYISKKYSVGIHLCACGCKQETVTPFGEDEWQYIFDEKINTITISPSIGNFKFNCHSHYWIKNNQIIWC